ncbi:MAG: hypothetical protein PUB98_04940 [Clostridiales bacterium]|nr:hypothetical protein [Clostridiales bacterium]
MNSLTPLGIFIFFVGLLSLFLKKNTKAQKSVEQSFWERERRSNLTRRQDISGLPYITIPLDKFPIGICADDDLKEYEAKLTALSQQKLLNLGTQTNTDLKLKYGIANLNSLSDCEQRFTILCRTLVSYAARLIQLGYSAEAKTVLEFGIDCGSDLSRNYLMLADLYLEQANYPAFNELTQKASMLDSPMKKTILKHLAEKTDGTPDAS